MTIQYPSVFLGRGEFGVVTVARDMGDYISRGGFTLDTWLRPRRGYWRNGAGEKWLMPGGLDNGLASFIIRCIRGFESPGWVCLARISFGEPQSSVAPHRIILAHTISVHT